MKSLDTLALVGSAILAHGGIEKKKNMYPIIHWAKYIFRKWTRK